MRYFLAVIGALIAGLVPGMPVSARVEGKDIPRIEFSAASTADAPCGTGRPPPGHFPAEITLGSGSAGVTLTVRQGEDRLCYVVGGVAEAPVLRVRQGATLQVVLRNEIDNPEAIGNFVAATTLKIPNDAVDPAAGFYPVLAGHRHAATGRTNLHVHGFAVPPVVPQDEVLTGCADPAIGGQDCGHRNLTYRYRIPTDMPAGLYWYHPHIHGEVQAQILMGLFGAIIVEGPQDDARRAAGIEDRVLIIGQTQDQDPEGRSGSGADAPAPATAAWQRPAPAPLGEKIDTADEAGCSANTGIDELTLNGARVLDGAVPDSELAPLKIAAGTKQLWRVLNAATDAFLDLALLDAAGRPLPVEIVARDGAPVTDESGNPLPVIPGMASLPVPPAGRVEFLVTAPEPGAKAYLVSHRVDTGCAGDIVPERRLAVLEALPAPDKAAPPVADRAGAALQPAPDFFANVLARDPDRRRVLAFAEYPRPGTDDQIDYYIAERQPGRSLVPYEMGAPPLITVQAGTTEEWVIENWTNELHAFHIHQLHFRVIAIDGAALSPPPLLDVVSVPYARVDADGMLVPGRVKLRLRFPAELAGDIPFHCHLVDHEDNGMMAVLRIEAAAESRPVQKSDLPPGFVRAGQSTICRGHRGESGKENDFQ